MADPWLSTADMDDVSDELEGGRPDTCVVLTRINENNAQGVEVERWQTVESGQGQVARCRVEEPGAGRDAPRPTLEGGAVAPTDRVIALSRRVSVSKDDRVYHVRENRLYDVVNDPNADSFQFEKYAYGSRSED